MSATESVTALETNLITKAEAIEQALVDGLPELYREAIYELAPHVAIVGVERRSLSC